VALAELVRAIELDAAAQIRALRAAAEADAARIDADAARARDDRTATATQAFAGERQALADAAIAAAERDARARALATRAAMLERVHAAVHARLPELLDDTVGRALLAGALACAGTSPGVVRCAPRLVAHARAIAPPSLRVEGDAQVATGVVIELATGTQIVATLEALCEREWPRLAAAALAEVAAPAEAP